MRSAKQVYGRRAARLPRTEHECFARLSGITSPTNSHEKRSDEIISTATARGSSHAELKLSKPADLHNLQSSLQNINLDEIRPEEQENHGIYQRAKSNPSKAKRFLKTRDVNSTTPVESHNASDTVADPKALIPAQRPVRRGTRGATTNSAPVSRPQSSLQPATQQQNASRAASKNIDEKCMLNYLRPLLGLYEDVDPEHGLEAFQDWANAVCNDLDVTKIAEASYGEVYRLSLRETLDELPKCEESVLKIIPLRPQASVLSKARMSAMSSVEQVASELRVLQLMTAVPGYACFKSLQILQGKYPRQLLAAWRHYDKHVKKSEFSDPSRKGIYDGERQLWAVIEMHDAGEDLEWLEQEQEIQQLSEHHDRVEPLQGIREAVHTIWGSWDVFWNVAISLAKGEIEADFEHRDLHLGNICLRLKAESENTLNRKCSHEDRKASETSLQIDHKRNINFTGIETTLIDYTLSRAATNSNNETKDIIYFDLAKEPSIFKGNAEENYQYAIYRYMRNLALTGFPLQESFGVKSKTSQTKAWSSRKPPSRLTILEGQSTPWAKSLPTTNILWLHFILSKFDKHCRWARNRQRHTVFKTESQACRDKGILLEERLREVMNMICPENLQPGGLDSATALVDWAVEQGWLNSHDIGVL